MLLTFPTLAEKCLAAWHAAPRTISLAVVAGRHGAAIEHVTDFEGTTRTYTFDDDTSLVVRGQGKSHKVLVRLP